MCTYSNICSICKEKFSETDSNIIIVKHCNDSSLSESRKRGHYFHRFCIDQWRRYGNRVCPLDREQIRSTHHIPGHIVCGLDLNNFDNFYKLTTSLKPSDLTSIKDINIRDFHGRTLFYCACQVNNMKLVKNLIKYQADPSIPNNRGFTPLMLAVCNNSIELFQYLLRNRKVLSSLKSTNKKGWTALEYAVSRRHLTATNAILDTYQFNNEYIHYLISVYYSKLQNKLFGKDIINNLFIYLKST